jgi:1-deoxy-D-xylulose-5-phosphate synthase
MDCPLLNSIRTPADLKRLSIDQLPQLAQEIREAICEQVARTGGHLAPNLGVVELTIALHYVFDFGHDRLLFDVGHQCYPHKLLTGRLDMLPGLRSREGMAGFPDPDESAYDLFAVGHAGTAISTAVGMARGDQLNGEADRKSVALVGDASIVNGLAFEGLNNAGTLDRQFLVVLNDNGMSISDPQGAMAAYFDRIRVSPTYGDFKKRAHKVLEHIPGGSILEEIYHRGGEMLKHAIATDHMFEHFGLVCIGPIDGHDLPTLVDMFNEVRDIDRPVLLHAKTVKGKGYGFSEDDATAFHSPKPFTVDGCRVEVAKGGRSFTSAFADAMLDLMAEDEKVYAVTAAMGPGTGVDRLIAAYPDRTRDTGICESHAMDMCAGIAKTGLKPFFAVYSTFSQRALDQAFQEVALQGLPVRVCMDRAGLVGGDGAVHHGFMDVSMFRVLPGAVLLAASDEPTLRAALRFMAGYEDGPTFLRYPRDNVAEQPFQAEADCPPFELGQANLVMAPESKPDLVVLAYGTPVYTAAEAVRSLGDGYDVALYDARFAKPVDAALLKKVIGAGVPVLTIEDHALAGGFGSAVLEACNELGLPTQGVKRLGLPMKWIKQAGRSEQLAEVGLDAESIARTIRDWLGARPPTTRTIDSPPVQIVSTPHPEP